MSTRPTLHQMARRHHMLDEQIHTEMLRPQPNHIAVARLKKEKLALKDQMVRSGDRAQARAA